MGPVPEVPAATTEGTRATDTGTTAVETGTKAVQDEDENGAEDDEDEELEKSKLELSSTCVCYFVRQTSSINALLVLDSSESTGMFLALSAQTDSIASHSSTDTPCSVFTR